MPSPIAAEGWAADQLRLTAFPESPSAELPGAAGAWFESCTGFPADEEASQRGTNFQAVGSKDGVRIALTVEPFRVDWRIVPDRDPGIQHEQWSAMEYDRALETLKAVASTFPANYTPTKRLAVGVVLVKPCESVPDGLAILQRYLPVVKLHFEVARDFLFQINVPTTSQRVDGLLLNRLTKWSVAAQQVLAIQISPDVRAGVSTSTQPLYAARLEADINTDAERLEALPREILTALADEMIELVVPLATEGVT